MASYFLIGWQFADCLAHIRPTTLAIGLAYSHRPAKTPVRDTGIEPVARCYFCTRRRFVACDDTAVWVITTSGQHRDVNTAGAYHHRDISSAILGACSCATDQHHDLARRGHADMLTIVEGVAVGMLIGELVAGIPLSRRIARYERRKPTSFSDAGDLDLDLDLDETIIAEWPDDRAAAMLEAWRTQRVRQGLHAIGWAADVDSAQAAQAVTKRGAFPGGSGSP